MPRFVFQLDPVLDHRQRLEDEQQLALAAVMNRLAEAQRRRDETIERRARMHERIRRHHAEMDGDELRATYAHCAYLERTIVLEQRQVDRINIEAHTERAKLIEATKGKKIIATLKERRREIFEAEAAAVEQREGDEINARRFDRALLNRGTSL